MKRFPCSLASHAQPGQAVDRVIKALHKQMASPGYAQAPPLGLLYLSPACAPFAQELLDQLSAQLPYVTDWTGCCVSALMGEAAADPHAATLGVMLCDFQASEYRVFSGLSPLPPTFRAATMVLHADSQTPELHELMSELAAGTDSQLLQGALLGGAQPRLQLAWSSHGQLSDLPPGCRNRAVFEGGLSGLALGPAVHWQARQIDGWRALGATHRVTDMSGSVVTGLNNQDALEVMLRDAGACNAQRTINRADLLALLRDTWVEVAPSNAQDGPAPRSWHAIVGVNRAIQGLVLAAGATPIQVGMQLRFCQSDTANAQRELRRVGTALRAAFEPNSLSPEQLQAWREPSRPALWDGGLAAALYFRSPPRNNAQALSVQAEWQTLRHALGPVPVLGIMTSAALGSPHLPMGSGMVLGFGPS